MTEPVGRSYAKDFGRNSITNVPEVISATILRETACQKKNKDLKATNR